MKQMTANAPKKRTRKRRFDIGVEGGMASRPRWKEERLS